MKPAPICTHPPIEEIQSRLEKVQSKMSAEGLDYYLCHDPDNVFYLTNFYNYVHERPFILLIPKSGKITFLMPKLEEPHVRIRSVGVLEYLNYFEFPAPKGQEWSDRMQDVLKPEHKIGVESLCPNFVLQTIPGKTITTDIVDDVRMVKSEYEIGRLMYTCQLVSKGMGMLLKNARPGRMVIDDYSAISGALTKKILMDNPNTNMLNTKMTAVSQPPNLSHDPHNFTDVFVKQDQGGPHVCIVSGLANGYGAEIERTFFLNEVPEAAKKPFDDMLAARALAFELTVPGNSMSDVDAKVNQLLKNRGYEDYMLHRTGHSFGVTNHEAPFLAEGYEHEIKPNMIFSIEPGIYIPGTGGFRFSDTVLITEAANLNLTEAPETLQELTFSRSKSLKDSFRGWMINRMSKK